MGARRKLCGRCPLPSDPPTHPHLYLFPLLSPQCPSPSPNLPSPAVQPPHAAPDSLRTFCLATQLWSPTLGFPQQGIILLPRLLPLPSYGASLILGGGRGTRDERLRVVCSTLSRVGSRHPGLPNSAWARAVLEQETNPAARRSTEKCNSEASAPGGQRWGRGTRIQRGQRGREREELPERSKGLRGRGGGREEAAGRPENEDPPAPGNSEALGGIPQKQARWMGRPEWA